MTKRCVVVFSAALLASTALASAPHAQPRTAGTGTNSASSHAESAKLHGLDLDTTTIPQLQHRRTVGALTSTALTHAYLHRIRTVDPTIHAVLRTDPTAARQAAASDARQRSGRLRGPLDGIPVLVKDNVNTRGLKTTAGSQALNTPAPDSDATLVRRLRAAGAVILGKTNLSEWANFRADKSTSGWSAVGGQTHNPHVLDRNPCGSSAGSAAGLAASLSQVAIGTETDGSIVCPAGMNGVVGLKPSHHRVSGSGVVPISAEQDTPGPMARNTTDTALTFAALTGNRTHGSAQPAGQPRKMARPQDLHGKRIGLWRLPSLGPKVNALMTSTARKLRRAGAQVVEVTPPHQKRIAELEFPALLTEFHRDINAYLATRNGPRTLSELVRFNNTHPAERTCFAGQELFTKALAAPPASDPQYRAQRAELKKLSRHSIDATMSDHHLDAIASPTNPPAWKTSCARGDNDVIPSSTPAAVAGYPSLTVPAGSVNTLPVGVLLMAGHHQDGALLSLGSTVEQRLNAWRAPRYLPSVDTKAGR